MGQSNYAASKAGVASLVVTWGRSWPVTASG